MIGKKILWVVIIVLLCGLFVGIYLKYNPSTANFFPQCPSYRFLHLYCPGCGSQRATHQLLQGNISSAFSYNPLMVIMLPIVVYALAIYGYNFLFDKKVRIHLFESNHFVWGFFIVIIFYFVLRNIPLSLFDFLRPPQ